MRCIKCDYRLWNLAVRTCPECGEPFKPSDFDFVPNTVKFACPDCGQDYYGTDKRGHLSPRQFECVKCARPLDMDDMLLSPAEGVNEDQTRPDENPWLHREQVGKFKAYMRMLGRGFVGPARLMRSTRPDSALNQAWWYLTFNTLIVSVSFAIISAVYVLFMAMMMSSIGGGGGPGPAGFVGIGAGMSGVTCAGNLLFVLLFVAIWGLLAHAILRAGGDGPAHTIGRTYQALCYSSGPFVIAIVPCLWSITYPMALVWWMVSAVLALREGQRVGGLRATIAVITLPLLCGALLIGSYAYFIYTMVNMSSRMASTMKAVGTGSGPGSASYAASKLMAYAGLHQGAPPDHALRLVLDQSMSYADFANFATLTTAEEIPIGETTIDTLETRSTSEATALVDAAAAALPGDVVAHRVGDLVFTYHGMNFSSYDGRLWTVIYWPDPDSNSPPFSTDTIEMAQADGVTVTVMRSSFDEQLAEQNTLRGEAGLPPLPHPSKITHDKPGRPAKE